MPAFMELAREWDLPLRGNSPARRFTRFYGRWGGQSHPEQISVESLTRMLANELAEGITELICHPGFVDPAFSSSYSVEREVELRTLCDPAIRRIITEQSIQLTSHQEAGGLVAASP